MPTIDEYPKTISELPALVENWKSSRQHIRQRDGWDYFIGDNPTIRDVKRYYWSSPRKLLNADGTPKLDKDGKETHWGGGMRENKFVANYHLPYGVFADIVSQKVNTLLDEQPSISGWQPDAKFIKQFGYALKQAGIRASAQGVGYIYQDFYGNLTVFQSENCIPYYGEYDGDLKALIRFWDVSTPNTSIYSGNGKYISYYTIVETYTQDGLTVYSTKNKFGVIKPTVPYKFRKITDFEGDHVTGESVNLPIVLFRNNENCLSDLKPSVRSKIDLIDIVNSGFANNIEDFSELYWVVKNASGMDADDLEDFTANIARTKKIVLGAEDSAEPKTLQIPVEARTKFVEELKRELVFETGIIDSQAIAASDLTATAIKAMTLKLRQRVSDFEWEAYRTATEELNLYQRYRNASSEFDIDFSEMLLDNQTEMIDNLVKIFGDLSSKDRMQIIKRAGYVDDVDKALERKQAEALSIVKLVDTDNKLQGGAA